MKWIKTAIGAVIAVISIGIIATIVYKMTQSSEVMKEVSFDIDYDEGKYYPISIYNEILEYGVIDDDSVINIVSGYLNNDELNFIGINVGVSGMTFYGFLTTPDGDITIDSTIEPDGFWFNEGDIDDDVNIKIVFAVPQPPQLSGNSAVLILLVPIVFVGGVLLYFYKPFKKD